MRHLAIGISFSEEYSGNLTVVIPNKLSHNINKHIQDVLQTINSLRIVENSPVTKTLYPDIFNRWSCVEISCTKS